MEDSSSVGSRPKNGELIMTQRVRVRLSFSVPVEIQERLDEIERRSGWGPRQALARAVEEGLSIIESQLTQCERVCSRCQNADGDEQGAHGDWYCSPCYREVTK